MLGHEKSTQKKNRKMEKKSSRARGTMGKTAAWHRKKHETIPNGG